jgi:hypothetical protein
MVKNDEEHHFILFLKVETEIGCQKNRNDSTNVTRRVEKKKVYLTENGRVSYYFYQAEPVFKTFKYKI